METVSPNTVGSLLEQFGIILTVVAAYRTGSVDVLWIGTAGFPDARQPTTTFIAAFNVPDWKVLW